MILDLMHPCALDPELSELSKFYQIGQYLEL